MQEMLLWLSLYIKYLIVFSKLWIIIGHYVFPISFERACQFAEIFLLKLDLIRKINLVQTITILPPLHYPSHPYLIA